MSDAVTELIGATEDSKAFCRSEGIVLRVQGDRASVRALLSTRLRLPGGTERVQYQMILDGQLFRVQKPPRTHSARGSFQ